MKKETKSTALAVAPDASQLATLDNLFPQEPGFVDKLFPRITYVSQDQLEGKGKDKKVVVEAGTFFKEYETDEIGEDGKKVWEKEELGQSIDFTIIFQRKQLKYYDEGTEEFTSSPVYDTDDEIVPLFLNKKEIFRGTPAELKSKYEYTDKEGKKKSRLEENRILYVIYEGEVHQLNLRGSSMYSFLTYARKTKVNAVVTTVTSEAKEKGTIEWNQMVFTPTRQITKSEADDVIAHTLEIVEGIKAKKAFFASQDNKPAIAGEVSEGGQGGKDDF